MTETKTFYMIRTKDKTKYLVKNISKYGTAITLSKHKDLPIIEEETIESARERVIGYLRGTKNIKPSELEIVKAKKVVTIEENKVYSSVPETYTICSGSFGYSLGTQEEYEKYPDSLGPTLETAKTRITKEMVSEWINIFFNFKRKIISFDYTLKMSDSWTYTKYVDVVLKNIVWE